METIEMFMWGYQRHFQCSAQTAAEKIFSRLASNLEPCVFLVGVLNQNRDDRHTICLEPEDCGYNPSQFAEVKKQAEHIEAIDSDRNIWHTHPIAQERHEQFLKRKALRTAIHQIVNHMSKYHNIISFCSYPVQVEQYWVIVVLQFNRERYLAQYSLTNNERDRLTIYTSLLDATVALYFEECTKALITQEPGSSFNIFDRDYDEVIRTAGKNLMYTPSTVCREFEGWHGLFEACNTISSLNYEGAEGIGKMLISKRGHPNVEITLTLLTPVKLQNYRAVRKLLEMSSDEICLLSDSGYIYGLGNLKGSYEQRAEDLFLVNFTKHYTWELLHADHVMMRVAYRQPELPKASINKHKFETDIKRIFPEITSQEISRLWDLVLEATKQKHGTMVVVSSGAKEESNRLKNQATVIEPVEITTQIMKVITAIDGAVLIDPSSTCYAIGVILDGLASEKGSPGRGARYNSAIRYVETNGYPCMAIVVSEDGSIDLVPNLMPQILRSLITKAIERLKELKEDKNFDSQKFYKVIDWLSKHKFYLNVETCNTVNSLKQQVQLTRDRVIDPMAIRINYPDFSPNPEINESYFLDE
ncbi:DNA integrity scanning protein DisA nucleotide-binding domain protein [Anabaena azotica]|uniref:DNA integrity scanning protein DisA nucleotide-binding domain protein n=1 Tax=Anabaena azotica FACHB-119 TaxID=947527 RepID=A0ABR8DDQ9_9NOST|nr:DNA integrity scanning protein DisA nucleotide-binding domain protein [Anabaena azotica]MBD2505128.1 DNA integrity scanning protein DisA nucleotide-binding domain protein [Anabaena azotica FACHB-119]